MIFHAKTFIFFLEFAVVSKLLKLINETTAEVTTSCPAFGNTSVVRSALSLCQLCCLSWQDLHTETSHSIGSLSILYFAYFL